MNRVEIHENKTKLWLLFILMAVIEAGFLIPIGIYFLGPEGSIDLTMLLLSAAVVLIVGWAISKCLARIQSKSPYLIFEREFITIFPLPQQPMKILIRDIDGVIPYVLQNQKYIGIVLRNEEERLENVSPRVKRMAHISKSAGFPAFNIHLNYIAREDLPTVMERFEAIGLPLGVEMEERRSQ
ncbi:STM3941 family protein [Metabacillus sp. FJAT-52054]|uniref:STM3941 family protein n=1 Tax=Metabacillus sediminis TaxID=3117746 RepID=A0ABZ2NFD0_9BACI